MGIHLEGLFLCANYRGAMPEHLLQRPNMELLGECQDVAHGDIRYITVSSEVEGIPKFASEMKELGMVVVINHSEVDYDTAKKAVTSGAMTSTHMDNVMRLLHRYFLAIWETVLEDDNPYCEIICDGRHLYSGIVHLIIKTKGLN